MRPRKDVLNLGFVELVDYMGGDAAVVQAARVSYDGDALERGPVPPSTKEQDRKLIHYLVRNLHTSPSEHTVFKFHVRAPLFVLRQWHRHRTWSYNEMSGRYCSLDEGFFVPELDTITTQSTSNKQMRTKERHPKAWLIRGIIKGMNFAADSAYRTLLWLGAPRELARTVLPLTTYTRMYATVDLHNLLHFIRLRDHDHAQYEIRVYAQAMLALIREVAPLTVAAFEEYNHRCGDTAKTAL